MKALLRFRPSPAMAVAMVALFVSLGGVSYGVATGSIDSREIRNNTVSSADIRNNNVRSRDIRDANVVSRDILNNAVTGSDVRESTLAEVPSAGAVDGISAQKVNFAGTAGTASATVLNLLGVTFAASCDGSGDLDVRVSSANGGQIQSASTDTTDVGETALNELSAQFTGTSQDILAARDDNQLGHTEVRTNQGGVVTVNWQADNPGFAGNVCLFSGTGFAG
jgi:hypothetical protein